MSAPKPAPALPEFEIAITWVDAIRIARQYGDDEHIDYEAEFAARESWRKIQAALGDVTAEQVINVYVDSTFDKGGAL